MQSSSHIKILVFSKTAGYRHESIPAGIAALANLCGGSIPIVCDASEDASVINSKNLLQYTTVLFLHTSGDFLDEQQLNALKRYIQGGGGFVGIHCAAAGMLKDSWYGGLIGSAFTNHPVPQEAVVAIEDAQHVLTRGFPTSWKWHDEWYNFRSNPRANVHVLMSIDEGTYQGGTMDNDHPLAWCQEFDGGRSFYTSLGHFDEAWEDELFVEHVRRGILWTSRKL